MSTYTYDGSFLFRIPVSTVNEIDVNVNFTIGVASDEYGEDADGNRGMTMYSTEVIDLEIHLRDVDITDLVRVLDPGTFLQIESQAELEGMDLAEELKEMENDLH